MVSQKTPLQINVVTVRSGWILQKIARRIVEAGNQIQDVIFTLSHHPKLYGVNFYCDVQNCYGGPSGGKDIGLFTHVHENDPSTVSSKVLNMDFIFHMAFRYIKMFEEDLKYPRHQMGIMVPFEVPAEWEVKRPRIGIFQRGHFEGKGYQFMQRFVDKFPELCKQFDWLFVGNDWDKVVTKLGEHATWLKDSQLSYPDGYKAAYDKIDYLLIPSKWEGGPIACLEAVSLGIPVIAADVGWCKDWTADVFFPNDIYHLSTILSRIPERQIRKAERVRTNSYERCAQQIIEVAR